jgi:hypothetical protein
VRTKQAGKLVHLGAHAKSDDGLALTACSADFAKLPYVIKRAIPIMITLDGRVFYPQLKGVNQEIRSADLTFSAQFLER